MSYDQRKVTVSTTLDPQDRARVERLAQVSELTPSHIVRKALLRGLPTIEQDVLGAAASAPLKAEVAS